MDATVTIDADLVERLVAGQFPQWAGLPVCAVEPGGWDNRTFRLGHDMLVRLPSKAGYAAQVEKEEHWLPRLAQALPLPIPAPMAKGHAGSGYPWVWSIYRWLRGDTLAAAGVADRVGLARALAGFLKALHRVDVTGGPTPGAHNFERGGDLAVYDGDTRAGIKALGGRIDAGEAQRIWQAALAARWAGPPVWVHGDVAPGNLLVMDGRLSAVIDFGGCAVGDPACDLVMAWTWFDQESRAAFREALPLGEATWARARGWALWKALFVASGKIGNQREVEIAWRVLGELVGGNGKASRNS